MTNQQDLFDIPFEDHIDNQAMNRDLPAFVRAWIIINRLPALEKNVVLSVYPQQTIYAKHDGKWCKLWMASRMGDVGICYDLDARGYDTRVLIKHLSDFQKERP